MSITRKTFWSLAASALLLGAVFHVAFLTTLIYLSEAPWVAAEKKIEALSGGPNALAHNVRLPSAFQEAAVRISACALDLRSGGVILGVPETSLDWVVSAYSRGGENFFSISSAEAGSVLRIFLSPPGSRSAPETQASLVERAPRDRGVVLFRVFEVAGTDEKTISDAQASMICRPAPEPSQRRVEAEG